MTLKNQQGLDSTSYLKMQPLLKEQQTELSVNLTPEKVTRTQNPAIQRRYPSEFEVPSFTLVICSKFQQNLESHMFWFRSAKYLLDNTKPEIITRLWIRPITLTRIRLHSEVPFLGLPFQFVQVLARRKKNLATSHRHHTQFPHHIWAHLLKNSGRSLSLLLYRATDRTDRKLIWEVSWVSSSSWRWLHDFSSSL